MDFLEGTVDTVGVVLIGLAKQTSWLETGHEQDTVASGNSTFLYAVWVVKVRHPFATLSAERVDQLVADFEADLKQMSISPAEAGSRRGKLGFARSSLFGRYGSAVRALLACRQYAQSSTEWMSPALSSALRWFQRHNVATSDVKCHL